MSDFSDLVDWNAVTALSTIAIAFLGFLINRNIRRDTQKTERYSLLVEYRREISDFAAEFFQLTARAIAEAEKNVESRDQKEIYSVSADLSSHIDKGRFIFPNYVNESGFGREKGPAFEGYRREPLDAILAAYFAVESLKHTDKRSEFLRSAHIELVRTRQPLSKTFDPLSEKSLLIESRRSFLNSVVPSTFPREWRIQFAELFGKTHTLTDQQIENEIERQVKS